MKRLKVVLGLVMASMLTFTGCMQMVKTEEGKSKDVVATVYGENITKADFDKRFEVLSKVLDFQYKLQEESDAKLKKEGKEINTTDQNRLPADKASELKSRKEQFLNVMVNEKIIEYNAKKKKVEIKDKELDESYKGMYDAWIKQYGSKEKLETEIKSQLGLTLEEYEKFTKESMKAELNQNKIQQAIIKDVKVTDEDAKKEYNENPYKYTTEPNKLIFTHILVTKKEDADKIKKELDGGANMAELAKKYSEDEGSKNNGGKYAEGLEYASLDPAFIKAAVKLKLEEVSAPIHGQHGYYIIKVHSKKEYPMKAFDSVKKEIDETLLQTKQMTVVQAESATWEKDAKIKTYADKL